MSKSTATKKRKKLVAQGSNVNLESASSYFSVPGGFIRQYWKPGNACFTDIERWVLSSTGKSLLQTWDSTGRGPRPIEGCEVRYSEKLRSEGREIRTRIRDCTVARKKGNLIVRSGDREIRLPLAMKSLEVKVPFSGEFRKAGDVFG